MVVKPSKADRKIAYNAKLCRLLDEYSQILIVAADNVGSNQLQNIRQALRDHSILLMGKNTMMTRTIRLDAARTGSADFLHLVPLLQVAEPARVGLVAPVDVCCSSRKHCARSSLPDLFSSSFA